MMIKQTVHVYSRSDIDRFSKEASRSMMSIYRPIH